MYIGLVNGKHKTLQEGEPNVFVWETETFWFFKLQDKKFKEFILKMLLKTISSKSNVNLYTSWIKNININKA